jgi:hypothetical protein
MLASGMASVMGLPSASPARDRATASRASTEQVWAEVGKSPFAIVSYVAPAGEPRSSGIVYAAEGRHLFLAVAPAAERDRSISVQCRRSFCPLLPNQSVSLAMLS